MQIIKCPQCGESNLEETGPGEFKCKVCGATIRNDKIDEILELLKSDPDNFIGNIKFRLNKELKKPHLDIDTVKSLADKVLDKDPEDIFCSFLNVYTQRKKYRLEYKDYLKNLTNIELPSYKAMQIGRLLVQHYEGYYDELIVNFLKSQNVYSNLYEDLKYAINNSTNETILKDPYVKRDVFVISDDDDFDFATKIVDLLNDNNISTWFEPVNFDYDSDDRLNQVITASKNTKYTLVINSNNFNNNKELKFETNKIIETTLDDDLKEHNLARTLALNIDNSVITLDYCVSYDYENFNELDFIETIKANIKKVLNKQDTINHTLLNEIVELRKSKHFKKALRRVEDLLEEDLSIDDEFNTHIEALRCLKSLDDEYSDDAYNHANKIKKMVNPQVLSKYEEELPILMDEREVYKKGLINLIRKNYDEALSCFMKAGKKNYSKAYNKIGEMHLQGHGFEKDTNEAIKYFTKASELGCIDADLRLGMMYLVGNKIDKNEYLAVKYLEKGATKNNPYCALNVAKCYHDGLGTVKNDNKYYEYLKIAARQDLLEAINLLGKCYKYGVGTEVNTNYAQKCFEYAASKGDIASRRELMGY